MICWFLQNSFAEKQYKLGIFYKIIKIFLNMANIKFILFQIRTNNKRSLAGFFTPWIMFFMLIRQQLHKFHDFFFHAAKADSVV